MGASPPGPVCRVVRLRVSPFNGAGCPATHLHVARVARRSAYPAASRFPTPRLQAAAAAAGGARSRRPTGCTAREAGPGRAARAPLPEAGGSGLPQSRSARRPELQHPCRRLQEQRERHRGLSSAIPTLCRPGWQDAAGVPGVEAQPAAGRESLLTRVLLVSSLARAATPRRCRAGVWCCRRLLGWGTEGLDVGALSARASFRGWGRPTLPAWSPPAPGVRTGREQGGEGDPATWWQGRRVSVLCRSRPREPPVPERRRRRRTEAVWGESAQQENGLTPTPVGFPLRAQGFAILN